ncbi:TPA: hypothetical protein MIU28_22330 [Klebsiella pneumoniae]|uniref:hypothetical protein n=1 Tax=Klebsiella pneumoniae TaxID=573 RepID=UPI00133037F0|nr:hypothetical protein [Klebsiella pneumoniae]HDT2839409.1 hypothetical protein [Klebsiella pneumoniae subsp. pneumoniae]ELA2091510.1 hypothetical protein [Klebsiella pneumoniae]MBG1901663.1 hypothetical protein [Klebsiella pneumoniae]MBG1925988.1 hypothetical protein [Klebsiella pneumoniae]MCD5937489.1 hypothetical protein [Klebsiella pneumoniae]
MTNITELAQSLKRRAASANEFGEGLFFIKADDVLALVEALEKVQSANAAQDDHINQQQDRIEQLEKRNAELGKYAKELESFRTAYMEWSDKTDWVQGDMRFDVLIPWGKHRADVLKAYIERLESRTVKLPQRLQPGADGYDDWYVHSDDDGEYLKVDDVLAMLTAAGIKVEAE